MENKVKNKIDTFFTGFNQRKFKKGQTIVNPDQDISSAYYIKSGYVKTYAISTHGVETTIHLFSTGSFFPMMTVIANIPNRYYYEALTPAEIYTVPKEKVLNFLHKNPDVLFDLTSRLLKGLDKLSLRIEQLTIAKASSRLTSILLFLSEHFGEIMENRTIISEIFTHRDIASLAGLSRETTSREWKKLERKNLVTLKNRSIIIHSLENLKKEL